MTTNAQERKKWCDETESDQKLKRAGGAEETKVFELILFETQYFYPTLRGRKWRKYQTR